MALLKANTGIGTTNPTSALHVIGDALVTGVVTATTFNGNINTGVATITTATITNLSNTYFSSGISTITTINNTNLNTSGVGTISTIRSGSGIVTTLSGTNLSYTNGNIVSGVVTTISGTNLNYTGIGTITNFRSTTGIITDLTNTYFTSGIATITEFNNTRLNSGLGTITTFTSTNSTITFLDNTNINSTGVITATRFSTGASGTGINITSGSITGPSTITIDPAGVGDNTGAVRIKGDLYVDGTQFVVNSSTIELADLRVGIATTVGTNLLLDGGGIGIGSTNILKTFTYNNASDSLKSSENFDIASGKVYKINGTEVLSATQLTVANINSSGIGTITTLNSTTGTITNLSGSSVAYTTANVVTGVVTSISGTNLNYTGVGTIATLNSTTGTITNLSGSSAAYTNANIVTGIVTNLSGIYLNYTGVGTIATLNSTTGTITNLSGSSVAYTTANVVTGVVTSISGTDLNYMGVGTIATLNSTTGTITNLSGSSVAYTTANVVTGIVTNIGGTNLNYTGVGTIATLNSTTGTITNLSGSSVAYTTANVVTGVVTSISGTNLNYTGVGTITTLNSTTGTITNLSGSSVAYTTANVVTGVITSISGTNLNYTGVGTIATLNSTTGTITNIGGSSVAYTNANIVTGVVTSISGTNLNYTGVGTIATLNSTFSTLTNINSTGIATVGFITATNLYVSGVTTSANGFVGNLTGVAASATQLVTPRTFEITGDIVASPISFNGTGNVSLAATIQPNSVALGTDTTGDYVQSVTGTANQITVSATSGEGSTPTLSLPSNLVLPEDVTVTRDLQVNRNLNVTGNITLGGTTAFLNVQDLKIADPDIILGFRTDAFGNDISNDTTSDHGGVALASTEGTPLVNLFIAGIETNPATYKKIMWFKSGTFAGLGTDAWLINYAVGIGSTQFPSGTRLAAGNVQFTESDLAVVRNINSSGIITASTGNITTVNSTNANIVTGVVTSISGTNLNYTGVGTIATLNSTTGTITNLSGTSVAYTNANIVTGVVTSISGTNLNYTGVGTITTLNSTTANITTANVVTGVVTSISGTNLNYTGIATLGIVTANQLYVSGVSTFVGLGTFSNDLYVGGNLYIKNDLTIDELNSRNINVTGISTLGFANATTLNVSGISTFQGQIQSTQANSVTTGAGQIYLNGATGNRIDFNTNGTAAPTFATRSVGTKIVLYPGVAASAVDFGFGIESATLWSSVGTTGNQFKWYAGTTNIATLFGTGQLVLGTTSLTGTATQPLQVTGGAYVSGRLGVGVSNPSSNLHVESNANTEIVVNAASATPILSLLSNSTATSFIGYSQILKFCKVTGVGGAGSIESLRIDSAGNVLVGTATSTGTASQPLQVTGGAYVSGNLGIGTTNPVARVDIQNTAAFQYITSTVGTNSAYLRLANTAGNGFFGLNNSSGTDFGNSAYSLNIYHSGAYPIVFSNNATERGRFDASGNLLIGAATSTGTASQRLQVTGGAAFIGVGVSVGIGTTNPTTNLHVYNTSSVTQKLESVNIAGYSQFEVTSGIGTTAISALLYASSAEGSIILRNNSNTTGTLAFAGTRSSGADLTIFRNTRNIVIGDSPAEASQTGTTNQKLQVQSGAYISGNTGIGTTNPTSKLYVVGDGYFTGVVTATTFNGQINAGVATITTLNVTTVTNTNINATGIITASQFSTGSDGIGINTDTISGPSIMYIDPSPVGVGTTSGIVRIKGDLYVDGTQFVVNSTTIELADLRVGIATTVGTNLLLDGGGIGIGSANIIKTFTYNSASDSLKSSENLDIASGKTYKINGTDVLSSTTLGSGVVNSSLTSVGTLGQLQVTGVSTFTNGPVLIGAATSTGTASQRLQTTGGAYVSGNVGIGTTLPRSTYKLDVVGDINFDGNLFQNNTKFVAGVGIGSTNKNPGSGVITQRIGVGFTDINFVGTGLSITGYGSTVVIDFGNLGGALSISTSVTSVAQDLTFVGGATTSIIGIATITDRLVYVPSTGRVGVGTSAPAFKLDVVGDINSSTALKVGGVNILDEALRLSIAFG